MKKSISRIIAFILAIVFSVTFISSETENLITVDSTSASYTVEIENNMFTEGKFKAVIYYDGTEQNVDFTGGSATLGCYTVTYTWYISSSQAAATVYYNDEAPDIKTSTNYTLLTDLTGGSGDIENNTVKVVPYYYYYVIVTIDGTEYTSSAVQADISNDTQLTVSSSTSGNDITLTASVTDNSGNTLTPGSDLKPSTVASSTSTSDQTVGTTKLTCNPYYCNYNYSYRITWYKSKESFSSEEDSAPLGYSYTDYYTVSNYVQVADDTTYTDSITVSGEIGRYYYAKITIYITRTTKYIPVDNSANTYSLDNPFKTTNDTVYGKNNGAADLNSEPMFIRNCVSTVVIEDHIAEDGTFRAVLYNDQGEKITDTSNYTFEWYCTTSGNSYYRDAKNATVESEDGRFMSSYYGEKGTVYYSRFYTDLGYFCRNNNATNQRLSEKTYDGSGGTNINTNISVQGKGVLPDSTCYKLVRENLPEENLTDYKAVFVNAKWSATKGTDGKWTIDTTSSTDDGYTCNVAEDQGHLRYYYVKVKYNSGDFAESAPKYVKYSNQVENGGFQDNTGTTRIDATIAPYWETTNSGYTENATPQNNNYYQSYYLLHPLLETSTYESSNSSGTYGNYKTYPGVTADETTSDNTYAYNGNIFAEINSTDHNTLYQTTMTVPGNALYWSIYHHARMSTATTSVTCDTGGSNPDLTDAEKAAGVTSKKISIATNLMYVIIMPEKDAEKLLENTTAATSQKKIDAMIYSIVGDGSNGKVDDDNNSPTRYQVMYTGTYNDGTNSYSPTIWAVRTTSYMIELSFDAGTDQSKSAAENALSTLSTSNYKAYNIVSSYLYKANDSSNYTVRYYSQSESYSDSYDVPGGQYLSRFFFVAGSKYEYNSEQDTYFGNTASNASFLTMDKITVEGKEVEPTVSLSASAGNFIESVSFSSWLTAYVRYWVYDADQKKYVLQDTETSRAKEDEEITAKKHADYCNLYSFTGSYISENGLDENDDPSPPGNNKLGEVYSFHVTRYGYHYIDLFYMPYSLTFSKEIVGLPSTMGYSNFDEKITIAIYTVDDTNSTTLFDSGKLKYDSSDQTLSLTTDAEFTKNTKYLIKETTDPDLMLTDDFDGWYSVDMYLNGKKVTLEYDEELGGFILQMTDDVDDYDSTTDTNVVLTVVNTYKPVAVEAEKSVIFGQTDVATINSELGSTEPNNDKDLNYKSLTINDSEKSVDDTDLDDENRLAVLSGDTLTYRVALTSLGSSSNVEISDTVPSGCTLVDGSIKILYQQRSKTSGSSFGVVKDLTTGSHKTGTSGTKTTYEYSNGYKTSYDSSNREITWTIPSITSTDVYYVEFAVTVDQIDADTLTDVLENQANWEYTTTLNSNDTCAPTMTSEVSEDSGKTTYTVTFSGLSTFNVTQIKDTLPEGFELTTTSIKINDTEISNLLSYTVKYYDSDGKELTGSYSASEIASFSIAYDSGISQNSGEIKLTFSGTQSANSSEEVQNITGISFTYSNETYSSVIAKGKDVTNPVVTDVTHLYLNIEKQIESEDPYQTFIFKVEYYKEGNSTTTPDGISYVNINCTEYDSTDNYYYGSRFIQTDRRGTYVITEVTDWSFTDYESVEASGENANATYEDYYNVTTDTNKVTVVLLTDSEDKNAAFLTKLGSLEDGTYTTSVFENASSDFAYRSGQAYTVNMMQ
ncbi:MAG: hypothetical protein LUI06_05385 [Ruminococcus sp.]|nr:hypothetical protein [Ruminococcus sp.]